VIEAVVKGNAIVEMLSLGILYGLTLYPTYPPASDSERRGRHEDAS